MSQGRGSYEDRTEMLRLIVDLVEASIYADNPDWRLIKFYMFNEFALFGFYCMLAFKNLKLLYNSSVFLLL